MKEFNNNENFPVSEHYVEATRRHVGRLKEYRRDSRILIHLFLHLVQLFTLRLHSIFFTFMEEK